MIEEYIEAFSQLPSITGKDVIDLEKYAMLPRIETYKRVSAFLETARKSREVRVLFIIAEWGEGKTSIYEGLLKKPEIIGSDIVIPISTKRLITQIKEQTEIFSDTSSPGIRFFGYLLYAIKDVIENDLFQIPPFNRINIEPKSEEERTMIFILRGLRSLFEKTYESSRIFLFIDEFEDIIDESVDIRSFIRAGLVDLINGHPRCLYQDPFAGRLHLLIAATPPAYERLRSEIFTDTQRLFGQRALSVELEKLNRKDAYSYILGILKYCWRGNLRKIPFTKSGMFNAIYLATLGNPRSIINVVELLLAHSRVKAPSERVKLITPEDFISSLSNQKIEIYGGEVTILDNNALSILYSQLEQKCRVSEIDVNACIRLLHLLLSNLSPISTLEIGKEIGISQKDLPTYLTIINQCFIDLWGINAPIIRFKRVTEKADEIYSKLRKPNAPENLPKILSTLEFYEIDESNLSLRPVIFIPFQPLGEIRFMDKNLFQNYIDFFTSSYPELRSEEEIINTVDRYIFDEVEKSDEDYIMLSPTAINIFYPSPSIFSLDFIQDIKRRFEIGNQLIRSLTHYEKEFYDGIINLLQVGGKKVSVERRIERHNSRYIEVINLSYKEVAQSYNVRAHILSLLKTSEEDFHRKINNVLDDMRTACIPLLIIFSWNPLSNEARGILEGLLIEREKSEKIFYYLEFPLTFIQCQQVCANIIARNHNYAIKEDKWKARASRILDEIKFEENLIQFIMNGLNEGYTIGQLGLVKLKPTEIPEILRTLIITDGSISERYKQIQELGRKFRIYGADFPICTLDIESESDFRMHIDELVNNRLVEKKDDTLQFELTPVERRILSILREYRGRLGKDELEKLFILVTPSQGRGISLDIYLEILKERRRIKRSKKGEELFIYEEKLDRTLDYLKREIDNYTKRYTEFEFGYLTSIKKRNINAIIVRECVSFVRSLIQNLEQNYSVNHEIKMKNQILSELLLNQLKSIIDLVDEFYKGYLQRTNKERDVINARIKSLIMLEESINNLFFANKNLVIRIKEKEEVQAKMQAIKELETRAYDEHGIRNLALKFKEQITNFPGLFRNFRECPVFDVKMIQIISEYEDLGRKLNNIQTQEKVIQGLIDEYKRLLDLINKKQESLVVNNENRISSIIQNWIKRTIGGTSEDILLEREERVKEERVGLELLREFLEKSVENLKRRDQKLETLLNILRTINEKEKIFQTLLFELRERNERMVTYFHETNVCEILKKIEEIVNNVLREYNQMELKLRSEVMHTGLSDEILNEHQKKLSSFLDKMISLIDKELKFQESIFNEAMKEIRDLHHILDRLLHTLLKKIENASQLDNLRRFLILQEDQIRQIADSIPSNMDDLCKGVIESFRRLYLETQHRLSLLREDLKNFAIRNALLEDDEIIILEILYRMNRKEFEFNEVIEFIRESIKSISEEKLRTLLFNLSRKGFLTLRILT
jgi:hypothetical protein